jgi:hypothetical protein
MILCLNVSIHCNRNKCQLNKYFTSVIYSCLNLLCRKKTEQFLNNVTILKTTIKTICATTVIYARKLFTILTLKYSTEVYFTTAVNYACKMLVKLSHKRSSCSTFNQLVTATSPSLFSPLSPNSFSFSLFDLLFLTTSNFLLPLLFPYFLTTPLCLFLSSIHHHLCLLPITFIYSHVYFCLIYYSLSPFFCFIHPCLYLSSAFLFHSNLPLYLSLLYVSFSLLSLLKRLYHSPCPHCLSTLFPSPFLIYFFSQPLTFSFLFFSHTF